MNQAPIIEVFSSFQGEGPHAGERHLFVRFQDCQFSCQWCDTPATFVVNKFCRVEYPPFSREIQRYPNPLSFSQLNEILGRFEEETLAITGGEPLQKVPFLKSWLPTLNGRRILLETAGIHYQELAEVIDRMTIVSMDIKLPSSTGMRPYWEDHEKFLQLAQRRETYVKVVVTLKTEDADVERAVRLVASVDPQIPFILQPASPTARFRESPLPRQLARWWILAKKDLTNVRVLPQIHKEMGIP